MTEAERRAEDVVENQAQVRIDEAIARVESEHEDLVENFSEHVTRVNRLQNLRQWKAGESGNPGGKPKTKLISQAYRKVLQQIDPNDPEGRTFAEIIALGMVRAAAMGMAPCAKEIRETTEGKLPETVNVKGDMTFEHVLTNATDSELDAIIGGYLERSYGGATQISSDSDSGERTPEQA